MADYDSNSPYFKTDTFGGFLDIMEYRPIPRMRDDTVYEVQEVYNRRPDLLAHDLYGDAGLWWVFAARNPNTITDPVWDFVTGISIFIPKQSSINNALGL